MYINQLKNGDKFGSHRVIAPKGALPQPAEKINNDVDIFWDNEILVDVETLNIDSASFMQIKKEVKGDENRMKDIIQNIVNSRGKMHNPVTGSGGIFVGNVIDIGNRLENRYDLIIGDKIASLVSLSLTPLKIYDIHKINIDTCQVKISGRAVLFESSIFTKFPDDLPCSVVLAVLDVCGAPAQTARLANLNDTVVIVGAGGKSGLLCAYEAKNGVGVNGMIIGIAHSEKSFSNLKSINVCDIVLKLDAQDALACYKKISEVTNGKLADLVINCVNIPNTELASIMMCRDMGKIYFFSMATSFTKAALGAEGVGKDIEMIIGNGYVEGHAEIALDILRKSQKIRKLYETFYS